MPVRVSDPERQNENDERESAEGEKRREGGNLGRRGLERLTSCSSPPLSLLPSLLQRGLAALMIFSGEPAHRGPSPSDTRGLPRHSGAGQREKGGREGV